jgi:hypothetical protein
VAGAPDAVNLVAQQRIHYDHERKRVLAAVFRQRSEAGMVSAHVKSKLGLVRWCGIVIAEELVHVELSHRIGHYV